MLMTGARTSVALDVKLDLQYRDTAVQEEPTPDRELDALDFVRRVFPGQRVEHLARRSMLDLSGYEGIAPTSLFFQSVHRAYANHHALGLRPEVLMYLVNAVIAETVRLHPEDYRHLFTTSSDKVRIDVIHDGLRLGDPNSPWGEAINLFDAGMRPHIPSGVMEAMLPKLSTATAESAVASMVAFMDTASPYYDYHTHTLCGIPRTVLFGEPSDYRKVFKAASALAQEFTKHLAVYFQNLLPVLDTIATTAETGKVDTGFWSSIYKLERMSGADRYTGWLSAFIWYVHKEDHRTKTNPLVVKSQSEMTWGTRQYYGVDSGSEPSHVSRVPFTWHYFGKQMKMHFIGGVLGVEVEEGAITPRLSYGVLHA